MASQPPAGVAIAVHELDVIRGDNHVLRGVSFEVPRGRITGLLGPSGCGKSTLMRSIVGVQKVAGGEIEVLGAAAGTKDLRSRVGYVTQAPSVYGDLSVAENLRYFGALLGVDADRIAATIETVGLAGFAERITGTLSGGQRSRVSLATALLNLPELLILDEPTVGLDPVLRADLWKTFDELAATGVALLISSHVMDEASECDELVLMREGALLRQTTPEALRAETDEQDLGKAFLAVIQTSEQAA